VGHDVKVGVTQVMHHMVQRVMHHMVQRVMHHMVQRVMHHMVQRVMHQIAAAAAAMVTSAHDSQICAVSSQSHLNKNENTQRKHKHDQV
jgi:hypothetical protein